MTGLSPDVHVYLLALIIGVVAGFASGGVTMALRLIRSPKKGLF